MVQKYTKINSERYRVFYFEGREIYINERWHESLIANAVSVPMAIVESLYNYRNNLLVQWLFGQR